MFNASAKFVAAVTGGSYTRLVKLELLDPVSLGVTADLTALLISGSIDGTFKHDGRRTLRMTIANDGGAMTPQRISDPFWINNALRVSYGVQFQDGTIEYVPLGTFLVNRAWARRDAGRAILDVDAIDFWKKMNYTALLTNASYAAGSTLKAAIEDLCTRAGVGATQRDIDPAAGTTLFHAAPAADLNIARGTSIADCLAMLTEDYGWLFWFDPMGVFTARPGIDLTTVAPVFTFNETDQMITGVEGGLEDSPDIKNHIGVSSTDPSIQPIFVEAKDNNQNSPTYILGAFGDRYFEYNGDWIQTVAQATSEAASLLRRKLMDSRRSEWFHGPRPELDVQDVGTMTSAFVGLAGKKYAIDSFTIPLHNAPQRTVLNEVRALPG